MSDVDARTTRRRRLIGGGLVAAFAVVLIAIVVVRSAGEKVLNENGDTLVLVGKDSNARDGVGLQGRLADAGGCLAVDGGGSGGPVVVVWPHGTTVKTPDPLRITVAGATYQLGDSVTLGGHGAHFDELGYFKDKVPSACRGLNVFVTDADDD